MKLKDICIIINIIINKSYLKNLSLSSLYNVLKVLLISPTKSSIWQATVRGNIKHNWTEEEQKPIFSPKYKPLIMHSI